MRAFSALVIFSSILLTLGAPVKHDVTGSVGRRSNTPDLVDRAPGIKDWLEKNYEEIHAPKDVKSLLDSIVFERSLNAASLENDVTRVAGRRSNTPDLVDRAPGVKDWLKQDAPAPEGVKSLLDSTVFERSLNARVAGRALAVNSAN